MALNATCFFFQFSVYDFVLFLCDQSNIYQITMHWTQLGLMSFFTRTVTMQVMLWNKRIT